LPEGSLLAVPITLLYDRGQTIHQSHLLHQRTPPVHIAVHPDIAQKLNIPDGTSVKFTVDGVLVETILHSSDQVPLGVALVPRSLGIPISAPVVIQLQVLSEVKA
jgi:predicted molibdopterin-dependent oxidoreductase YjgC